MNSLAVLPGLMVMGIIMVMFMVMVRVRVRGKVTVRVRVRVRFRVDKNVCSQYDENLFADHVCSSLCSLWRPWYVSVSLHFHH